MRVKSVALLIVFCFSLIPMKSVQSQAGVRHSLEDALLLMLTSETILLGDEENQEASSVSFLFAPVWDDGDDDLDDKTMAAILQALKDWRNELDTNCRLLTQKLRSEGRDCEADRVQATCDQYRQQINGEIGKYHDLRGDKRKAPTKVWHFLKRNGRNLWHRIGPVGRTFLRRLGPEIAQTVLSGGTLSGGVLRKLVKGVARSMGREKIQKIVFQGVERLLRGQIEILQAAGVDICDPDEELAGNEDAVMAEKWACSSETGYLGDYLHASTSNVEIDKQELLFDLTANPTTVELDLSFHGIARIPLQSASGEPAGYQKTEDLYTGEGSADWDGDYFYGSITMNRVETLYGRYEGAEDVVYDQTFDHAVFGGFSPELNQIHLCFDVHTREQFEGIKDQPFDQLLPNCATQNYFICTPEH